MFRIEFDRKPGKFLKRVEPKLGARLKKLFEVLQFEPVPAKEFDIVKLSGHESLYRVRLSSHRVTYCVGWPDKKIQVLTIERRKDRSYKGL